MQTPTPEETRKALSKERLQQLEKLANQLREAHGAPPPDFYLVGWLWKNLEEAERIGWESKFIYECLDNAYLALLEILNGQKPSYATPSLDSR